MTPLSEVLVADTSRRRLTLSPRPLGAGGEATVFGVDGDPELAVKLYHEPSVDLERRLEGMLLLAHSDEFLTEDGTARPVLVWPSALVEEVGRGDVIGYAMRRVATSEYLPLGVLFDPWQRHRSFPAISWRFLVGLARNLAGLTAALHERDLVFGDMSHANLVVSRDGYLCFLDCDSIQFTDPRWGEQFPCRVQTAEYAAPELQRDERSERSPATDNFSLAVLICRLLLVGDHPFMGIRIGGADADADVARNIADGYSYLTRPADVGLPAGTFDTALLPAPVLELANRAFGAGHLDGDTRPTADEWLSRLDDAMGSIHTCPTHRLHAYGAHLARCPWCERVRAGAPDAFPPPETPLRRKTQPAPPDGAPPTDSRKLLIALAVLGVLLLIVVGVMNAVH